MKNKPELVPKLKKEVGDWNQRFLGGGQKKIPYYCNQNEKNISQQAGCHTKRPTKGSREHKAGALPWVPHG